MKNYKKINLLGILCIFIGIISCREDNKTTSKNALRIKSFKILNEYDNTPNPLKSEEILLRYLAFINTKSTQQIKALDTQVLEIYTLSRLYLISQELRDQDKENKYMTKLNKALLRKYPNKSKYIILLRKNYCELIMLLDKKNGVAWLNNSCIKEHYKNVTIDKINERSDQIFMK